MTYTYRNKRTGNLATVPCRLYGPDWEQITEAEKPEEKPAPKAPAKKKPVAKKRADADG